MHPVKFVGWTARTTLHAVRHPISSTAYAAGMARGLAGAVIHGTTATGHAPDTGLRSVPTQREGDAEQATGATPATSGPPAPQRVPKPVPEPGDLPEPVVIEPTDEAPGESFATEPKAVSRASAHGGAAVSDAEIDAWIDEAMDRDDAETPGGTTGTASTLDPAVAKAIRSESEMLRKDAEIDPD